MGYKEEDIIEALSKDADSDCICNLCGNLYDCNPYCEPSKLCNECARAVADRFLSCMTKLRAAMEVCKSLVAWNSGASSVSPVTELCQLYAILNKCKAAIKLAEEEGM